MKRKLWFAFRSLLVVLGVVLLTSFAVDATDALNGSQSALSIFAKKVAEGDCPTGMVRLDMADKSICVDAYENSFSADCPVSRPASVFDTQKNINITDCQAVPEPGVTPAVFVTFHQAQSLCARRSARLPSPYEWYDAALGTPDSNVCNIDGTLGPAGQWEACVSARGSFDMVGNAWEWVDGAVTNGTYNGVTLPQNGYVSEADRAGVALKTDTRPSPLFNDDYFWSAAEGSHVMMRGGFYSSGSDGGLYSIHADIEPSFSSAAIGFRCVKDI